MRYFVITTKTRPDKSKRNYEKIVFTRWYLSERQGCWKQSGSNIRGPEGELRVGKGSGCCQ